MTKTDIETPVPLSFRAKAKTKAALERAAAEDMRSVSSLIEKILVDWLARHGFLKPAGRDLEGIADTINALDAEHAAMDPKPSPKKALNRMKAAITRDVQKKVRPKK